MHIWIAPGQSAVAANAKLTTGLPVAAAPPFIVIDPVGGIVSGTGFALAVAPVDMFPALSIAQTRYP